VGFKLLVLSICCFIYINRSGLGIIENKMSLVLSICHLSKQYLGKNRQQHDRVEISYFCRVIYKVMTCSCYSYCLIFNNSLWKGLEVQVTGEQL